MRRVGMEEQGRARERRGRSLGALIIASILWLIACEEPAPYEPELNIFCLLTTNAVQQRVMLERAYKLDELSGHDLKDVVVILSGTSFTDTLKAQDDTSGLYYSSPGLEIKPLCEYRLKVWAKDMDTVWGRTRLPGEFRIIHPEDGDTISGPYSIIFKKSEGAAVYWLVVYSLERPDEWFNWYLSPPDIGQDGTITYVFYSYRFSGPTILKIFAVDSNFQRYQEKLWEWEDEEEVKRLQEGIEGGLGVFGSAVVESISVFILDQ
jgi:hypothetical protein